MLYQMRLEPLQIRGSGWSPPLSKEVGARETELPLHSWISGAVLSQSS